LKQRFSKTLLKNKPIGNNKNKIIRNHTIDFMENRKVEEIIGMVKAEKIIDIVKAKA